MPKRTDAARIAELEAALQEIERLAKSVIGTSAPATPLPPSGTVAQSISPTTINITDADTGIIAYLQVTGGNPDSYSNPVDGGADAAKTTVAMLDTTQVALTWTSLQAAGTYNITVRVDNTAGTSAAFAIQIVVSVAASGDIWDTPAPPSGRVNITLPTAFPVTISGSADADIPNGTQYASWTALKNALRALWLASAKIYQINLTSGIEYPISGGWDFPFSLVAPKTAAKRPTAYILTGSGNNISTNAVAGMPVQHIEGIAFQQSPSVYLADPVASGSVWIAGPRAQKGDSGYRNDGKSEVTVVSCDFRGFLGDCISSDGADLISDNTPVIKFYDCDVRGGGNQSNEHTVYVHRGETWFVRCYIRDPMGGGHALKSDGFKIIVVDCVVADDSGDVEGFGTHTVSSADTGTQTLALNGPLVSSGSVTVPVAEISRIYCVGNLTGRTFTWIGTKDAAPLESAAVTGKTNDVIYPNKMFDTLTHIRVALIGGQTVRSGTFYVGYGHGRMNNDANVVNLSRIQDIRIYRSSFKARSLASGTKALFFTTARVNAFGGYHPTKFPILFDTDVCPPGPCTPFKSDNYSGSASLKTFLALSNGDLTAAATDLDVYQLSRWSNSPSPYVLTVGVSYTFRMRRNDGAVLEFDAAAGNATFTTTTGTGHVATPTGLTLASLPTATQVRVTNSGGALPGGLAAGTQYYWAGGGGFSTSAANASAGTKINITSAGTGTHTVHAVGLGTIRVPIGSTIGSPGADHRRTVAAKLTADAWDYLDLNDRMWNRNSANYYWGKDTANGIRKADGTLDIENKLDKMLPCVIEDCMFSVDTAADWTLFRDDDAGPRMYWSNGNAYFDWPPPPANHPGLQWANVTGASNVSSPLNHTGFSPFGTPPTGYVDFNNPGSISDFVCAWPKMLKNIGIHRSPRRKAAGGSVTQVDQLTSAPSQNLMGFVGDARYVNTSGALIPITAADPSPMPDANGGQGGDTQVVGAHASGTKVYVLSTTGFTNGYRVHIDPPPSLVKGRLHTSNVVSSGSDGGGPFITIADGLPQALLGRENICAFDESTTSPAYWIPNTSYPTA